MRLSIRARLTLWYCSIVVAVLVTGAVAGSFLQSRLSLQRMDDDLVRAMATLQGVMRTEFAEGLTLEAAAEEASIEVVVPDRTLILARPDGAVLHVWGPPLPHGFPAGDWRTAGGRHHGYAFRRHAHVEPGSRARRASLPRGGAGAAPAVVRPAQRDGPRHVDGRGPGAARRGGGRLVDWPPDPAPADADGGAGARRRRTESECQARRPAGRRRARAAGRLVQRPPRPPGVVAQRATPVHGRRVAPAAHSCLDCPYRFAGDADPRQPHRRRVPPGADDHRRAERPALPPG